MWNGTIPAYAIVLYPHNCIHVVLCVLLSTIVEFVCSPKRPKRRACAVHVRCIHWALLLGTSGP